MLCKLSLRNVRRQLGNYLIYFITVSLTVALLFAVSNIIFGENLKIVSAGNVSAAVGLAGITIIISIIVAFVLSYATSYMLKLRKREFGTYLTLGMSRKNILVIFISETMIICAAALVLGLLLGLFIYQGLMAVMMKVMEMEFSLAAYSVKGLVVTVALVIGIFVLASVTSMIYLKRVSIYDLIHGDKKVEKEVKHPVLWFALAAASFVIIIVSCFTFDQAMASVIMDSGRGEMMMVSLFAFAAALIIFHVGMARGLIYIFLKRKNFCARGTNTFVLRQLSGTLSSNSVMLGFIAFLLAFAVIGTNVSFAQKAFQKAELDKSHPYNIMYAANMDYTSDDTATKGILPETAEPVIEKYVDIENKYEYKMYTTGSHDFYTPTKWTGEGYESLTDSFMKESDFNKIIVPLGYEPLNLDDTYVIVANMPESENFNWENFEYERNGKVYKYGGMLREYPKFMHNKYFYIVIPDTAVAGMTEEMNYIVYDTGDEPYDAKALRTELTYMEETLEDDYRGGGKRCDYILREYSRQQENSVSAILVVGALFIAFVFLFLAMAILALKTLSGIGADRHRYEILGRLGAGRREQGRALFAQTFSFFMMPFALPLLLSIPIGLISANIMRMSRMETLTHMLPLITAGTAIVMTAIYILYYMAAYLIAKKAVIRQTNCKNQSPAQKR